MNASSGNKQYNKVCEKRAQRVKMQKKCKKKQKNTRIHRNGKILKQKTLLAFLFI